MRTWAGSSFLPDLVENDENGNSRSAPRDELNSSSHHWCVTHARYRNTKNTPIVSR